MRNLSSLAALLLLGTGTLVAALPNPTIKSQTGKTHGLIKGKSIGLNIGVTGPGLEFGLKFSDRLGARAKFSYFQYNDYPYAIYVSKTKVSTNTSIRLGIVELVADFFPFKDKIFRITAGPTFYTHSNILFDARISDNIQFNDMVMTPEEVGTVNGEVNWKRAGAYLGFGIGRTVPNKKFGYGFDLGCYYIGSPQLVLNATEKLAPTTDQQEVIEKNMAGYSILPYANFRISYNLTK